MCYYYGIKVTREQYIRLRQLEKALANYDLLNRDLQIGFDYAANAVLKPVAGKTDFELIQMEWGFIPSYLRNRAEVEKFRKGYKDEKGVFQLPVTTLNAKAENLFTNEKGRTSMWADAARHRRCLVLASGFYEWRHIFPVNKKTGQPLKTAKKYPYFIHVPNKEYFFMAGIWTPWTDKDTGETVDTYAIVTTEANPLMRQIHNSKMRMPSILNEDLAWEWLFGNLDDQQISEIAATQFPHNEMDAHTIAKDFTTALNPGERFVYEDLPPLEGAAPEPGRLF